MTQVKQGQPDHMKRIRLRARVGVIAAYSESTEIGNSDSITPVVIDVFTRPYLAALRGRGSPSAPEAKEPSQK